MTTNKELQAIRDAATPQGVGIQTRVFADKARNAELWDVEGRRYIDLAAGIAVCNTGHSHPEVVAAEAAIQGVILLTCGVRGNVIRFLPPLTIENALLTEALEIVGNIIRDKAGAIRKAS